MNTYRSTAVAVGLLFIVASATAIVGGSLILPIEEAGGLAAVAGSEGQVALGVLLELVLVFSVVAIAVLLFPVLRAHGEGLAMGYVGARVLEGVLLLAAAMSARVLLGLTSDAASVEREVQAGLAVAARHWTYLTGSLLMFGVSATILYTLLWRARLVPAWLSLWGLAGGVLILGRGVLEVGGVEVSGVAQGLLAAPVGLNEMVLAVWLIARGFDARGLGTQAVEAGGEPSPSTPSAAAVSR